jgi:hypothetical protein
MVFKSIGMPFRTIPDSVFDSAEIHAHRYATSGIAAGRRIPAAGKWYPVTAKVTCEEAECEYFRS